MPRPTTPNLGLLKGLPSDPAFASGVDEHFGPISDANLDKIDAAIAAGGSGPAPSGSHTIYVDGSRTDQYTPNGSVNQPFLTIQKAINQITANGDCTTTTPYLLVVAPGSYPENLDFSCPGTASVNIYLTGQTSMGPTTCDAVFLGTAGTTTVTMAANANRVTFMGFRTMGNIVGNGSVGLGFMGCYLGNGTSITMNGGGSLLFYDSAIWSSAISILGGNCIIDHSDIKTGVTWTFASGTSLSLYQGSSFLGPVTIPSGVSVSFNSARVQASSDITVASGGTLNFYNSQSLSNLICNGTANLQDATFASISGTGIINGQGITAGGGLLMGAAAPTVAAGQIGLGNGKSTTASAGTGQAPPTTVDSYLIINDGGVMKKIALFAN
jgi:hypothetical protein